jgi:hypothetical protein
MIVFNFFPYFALAAILLLLCLMVIRLSKISVQLKELNENLAKTPTPKISGGELGASVSAKTMRLSE